MSRRLHAPRLASYLKGGVSLLLVSAWYAWRWEPYHPVVRVRHVDVPSSWPPLTILHLSDLHLRRSARRLRAAQSRLLATLSTQPDLVCVTGDLCETVADASLVPRLLQPLHPAVGTFLIPGNHEYGARPHPALSRGFGGALWHVLHRLFGRQLSSGAEEAEAIVADLRAAGLDILRNEGRRVEVKGRSLWIAGSDSLWAAQADTPSSAHGRLPGEGMLALVHEPETAIDAAASGADLILAGHTHGGQVHLPFLGALYTHRVDPRITISSGRQMIGGAVLLVSAGFGQLLPLRFLCPPEITWVYCRPRS